MQSNQQEDFMETKPPFNFVEARKAVMEGRADDHPLWILLSAASDRDGYGLKPEVWEGPGEYQRVSTRTNPLGVLVRIPMGRRLDR